MSQLASEVYTIERIKQLYLTAKKRLENYSNVNVKFGDGSLGWQEHAPFDGIIVTAGATKVPQALYDQLKDGGRLVIPVGTGYQQILQVITRHGNSYDVKELEAVIFVPLMSGTEDDS